MHRTVESNKAQIENGLTKSQQKESRRVLVLVLTIGGILCLHYFTLPTMSYQHALYRMLFYLPLVLGALWFGLRGALWVSGTVSVLYLPYAISHWDGFSLETFHRVLEGALYAVIALILGLFVERDRRQHEALLRAESLAAMGKAVSEVAHDMKTPLVAIGGFANRLSRELPNGDPNRKKLEIIIRETSRLQSMVKDMLDFGGPLRLKGNKASLNKLVQECVNLAQPMAMGAEVKLNVDLEPSLPPVQIDVDRVKQAVLNLITNAIQASPAGEIVVVKTRFLGQGLVLEVIDCGCGIKPKDRDNLFKPFFSSKKRGTGLGLAIVKKVVEAHGGEVLYHSNPKKGVTFSIRLPHE